MAQRVYIYGAAEDANGTVVPFYLKKKQPPTLSAFLDKNNFNPLITKEIIVNVYDADQVVDLAKREVQLEMAYRNTNIGKVMEYCDQIGRHTCIILDKGVVKSKILMLTSNPRWCRRCREATKDEMILMGLGWMTHKKTYLAPAVRNNEFISDIEGPRLPKHRAIDLMNEFFGDSPIWTQ